MRWRFIVGLSLVLFAPQMLQAQATGQVTGTVTSAATLSPIAGANVQVVGTSLGAVTAADGRFTINNVPAGNHTIRVSMVGRAPQTATVTVAAGQTATVDIRLAEQAVALDELVVIGYGTARARDVTGAVASVRAEDLERRAMPTTAVANALQGKAPGVQVTSNSGAPGAGASVRVRGTNSISANSEPLYIVDGIPFGQGSQGTDNPLAMIDPNNIESITILKDASATAIYGARGANGVVLITTKRGQRGGSQLQLESSYGSQTVARRLEVLNGQEFMTLVNEARTNANLAPFFTADQIANSQTHDYLDLMLRRAPQQNHVLTLSGGNQQTRYLLSGSYMNQDGILLNTGFERAGLRLNVDQEIGSRFRIGASLTGARTEQQRGTSEPGHFTGTGNVDGGVYGAMQFPAYVAPRDADGNWVKTVVISDQLQNPMANLLEIQIPERTTFLLGNIAGDVDLATGLRLRSTVGGNFRFQNIAFFAPRTVFLGGPGGMARRYTGESRELTNENTLSFERQLGPGRLDAVAGVSAQTSRLEELTAEAHSFPSDAVGYGNLGAGSDIRAPQTNTAEWTLLSQLGRVNYNLLDRYLFTVTGRRDGSSRFGAENKWAFFPSAAFAWRVVDEPFLQNQELFSDLKLRLSYGRTGNQAVGPYQSLARLGTGFYALGAAPVPMVNLAPAAAAPNPNLKWETQDQVNAGLDFGVLDNRVTFSLDAYQTRTRDLLLNVPMPAMSGFATRLENVGSVRNEGIELALNTINFQGERFGWRSNFNVATNRNEVTSTGGVARILIDPATGTPSQANYIVTKGEPLGSMFGFKVLGLWQQGDECTLTNRAECTPGEFRIQDTDGNGMINDADRVIIGNADPKFYGGFTNNFSVGPFTLDAFFNFSYGNDVLNLTNQRTSMAIGVANERREVLDRWTPTNTDATIPRANALRPIRLYSTLVEDGSFLRLQTLSLGYQLPARLIPGTSAARLTVSGQNLWTLTNYSGFDPEVNRQGGDARIRGVDWSSFPRARVWNVGMNVTF
jgi:TonB-dependent starch-binding outer membrane protein SusC